MSKHTPGPWRIEDTRIRGVNADGEGINVVDCRGAMGGDDTDADMCLIAAAPDLLAALQRVAHIPCERSDNIHCTMIPHDANVEPCTFCAIRAAIAKATE